MWFIVCAMFDGYVGESLNRLSFGLKKLKKGESVLSYCQDCSACLHSSVDVSLTSCLKSETLLLVFVPVQP